MILQYTFSVASIKIISDMFESWPTSAVNEQMVILHQKTWHDQFYKNCSLYKCQKEIALELV